MRLFRIANRWLYTSHDYHHPYYDQTYAHSVFKDNLVKVFFRRGWFRLVVDAITHGQPTFKMLQAHGANKGREWIFADGFQIRSMQRWIDKQEGLGTVLLIASCNPSNLPITAKHSVVLHSDRSASFNEKSRGQAPIRLYVPNFGYCDTYHSLYKVLRHIQR